MGLRVGVDLVRTQQVLDSVAEFGQAYLDRVFTDHEQSSATGEDEVRARALAARFAAKEATMKVLRPGPDDVIPWTSIEIWRSPLGWCEVRLSAPAQLVADRNALTDLAVSFTHEGDHAVAVVVAMCGEAAADGGRDDP